VELEQAAEVRRLATALAARQTPDLEAWESLVLQAARQGGAGVLGTLLTHWQQHAPREVILGKCGQRMRSRGQRSKELLRTLGRVPFARSFYPLRTTLLSGSLSRRRAFGHRANHLFARRAPTDGASG
jgi:hypothetical protein